MFSLVPAAQTEVGEALVDHPNIKAVGFTGSLAGGRGARRPRARAGPSRSRSTPNGLGNPIVVPEAARAGRVRPIRPEDEALLHDLVAHMTQEDLRRRFLAPIRSLSHQLAARMTQIDYDREMALVAAHRGTVLGIARYFADPDRLQAEYAVAVRSDWKGRGIGYVLMRRLIEIARQYGIGELVGDVLRENEPMLAMCRVLGFEIRADPNDAALVRVRKNLA